MWGWVGGWVGGWSTGGGEGPALCACVRAPGPALHTHTPSLRRRPTPPSSRPPPPPTHTHAWVHALQVTVLLVLNNALQGILSSFFYKFADTVLKKYSSTIAT